MTREEAIKEIKMWGIEAPRQREVLETLIPELRESEDEKMRKAALEGIKYLECEMGWDAIDDIDILDVKEYLEKQKERGPLTKEEEYILYRIIEFLEDETCPSEWISLLHDIYCLPYEKQKEQKPEQYDIDVLKKHITKDSVSELAHTVIVRNGWEIVEKEQKPDDDPLDDPKFLKGFDTGREVQRIFDEQKPVEGEFPYNTPADTVEGEIENIWSKLSCENKFTATKIGFREVILHFVNYARNNAAPEWSEEDKKLIDNVVNSLCCYQNTLSDYQKEIVGEEIRKLKSLKPLSKQEWSGEDEMRLNHLIRFVEEYGLQFYASTDKVIDWLKSLRPQPKQEWSDEECGRLFDIEHYLDGTLQLSPDRRIACIDFIKSLRLQPHTVSIKDATKFGNLEYERGVKDGIQSEKSRQWKPSEEQMDAIDRCVDYLEESDNEDAEIMESLQEQLHILM